MATQREYDEAQRAAEGEVLVEISENVDGDLIATVTWGDWISDGVTRHGETVGPMTVGEALLKADEATSLYGLERVVVSLPRADLWNPNWGTLRRRLADTALGDDLLEADDGDEGRSPAGVSLDDEDGPVVNP